MNKKRWHQTPLNLFELNETAVDFPTDIQSILKRIQDIVPEKYASSRNFVHGAVTYLSPYISRGVINTRLVYDTMKAKGYQLHQMEKLVSELAWRDYFQQVYRALGPQMMQDIKRPQPDAEHSSMLRAIAEANTSIEAIDYGIQKLFETGYMHNHLRMYTASLACNIGKAHWHLPAKWMYYHLLDGDLASNTCSWQWVAGSFSSKKYYCNQENINRYTGSLQQGSYLDKSYDLLSDMPVPLCLQETTDLSVPFTVPALPDITLDANKPLLLYTQYNLDPDWRNGDDANRVLLLEPSHFSQYPVSPKVLTFLLDLAKNIPGLQVFYGPLTDLLSLWNPATQTVEKMVVSREHPAFAHFPGHKDPRPWLAPDVQGYFPSFFAYWKKVSAILQ